MRVYATTTAVMSIAGAALVIVVTVHVFLSSPSGLFGVSPFLVTLKTHLHDVRRKRSRLTVDARP